MSAAVPQCTAALRVEGSKSQPGLELSLTGRACPIPFRVPDFRVFPGTQPSQPGMAGTGLEPEESRIPIMSDASSDNGAKGTADKASITYWRTRTLLEFVKFAVWILFQSIFDTIHRG